MPSVQVNVWKGWGEKNAEILIHKITKIFTEMGIPAQAVEVMINEIPKTHWGINGEPASIVMKGVEPPK